MASCIRPAVAGRKGVNASETISRTVRRSSSTSRRPTSSPSRASFQGSRRLTNALAASTNRLHRRILFTILVSNNDDHLKNHGLLYAGGGSWALAPAFDINPQPFLHRELKTGISEFSGFDASVEAWVEAAPFFERTEDGARREAASMAETISARWRHSLLANGVTEDQCDEYAPAFEHEETRVALRMGSASVAAQDRALD